MEYSVVNIFFQYFLDIGKGKLTVGKIYGGLLIYENWKVTKFGNLPNQKVCNFYISLNIIHRVQKKYMIKTRLSILLILEY